MNRKKSVIFVRQQDVLGKLDRGKRIAEGGCHYGVN